MKTPRKNIKKPATKKKVVKKTKAQLASEKKAADKLKRFDAVLASICGGMSLRKSLIENELTKDIFYLMCDKDEEKAERYVRASKERHDFLFDEIISIADDASDDEITFVGKSGKDVTIMNKEFVARSNLKIEARKWALSKMDPKKYGDKIEIEGTTTHIIEME
jgi:hypothetical protein